MFIKNSLVPLSRTIVALSLFVAGAGLSASVVLSGNDSSSFIQNNINATFNTAGTFNQSFGNRGSTTLSNILASGGSYLSYKGIAGGATDQVSALVVDSSNRIVVGGYSINNSGYRHFALARFLPTGELDPSFGATVPGSTTSPFPGVIYITPLISQIASSDKVNALAIDSAGNIVAVGITGNYFAIARFTTDGILDTTFGANIPGGNAVTSYYPGTVFINASICGVIGNDQANAVAIDSEGRIVVGGYSAGGSQNYFAVARLIGGTDIHAGALDTTFIGDGGMVRTSTGVDGTVYLPNSICDQTPKDAITAILIGAGDTIFAGGVTVAAVGHSYFALANFNGGSTNPGYLNTNFTGGGSSAHIYAGAVYINGAITGDGPELDQITAMAFDSDTTIAAGGSAGNYYAVARFITANGLLDSTFGISSPVVGTSFVNGYIAAGGYEDLPNALVVDASQNIIMGGTSLSTQNGVYKSYYSAARFWGGESSSAGTLDANFSQGATGVTASNIAGTVYMDANIITGGLTDQCFAIGLLQDESLAMAGKSTGHSGNFFSVANVNTAGLTSGSLNSNFRVSGFGTLTDVPGTGYVVKESVVPVIQAGATALAVQSDGKIIIVGSVLNQASAPCFAVARYFPNGKPDTTFGALATGSTVLNATIPGLVYLTGSVAGGTNDQATAVTLDAAGNIFLIGSTTDNSGNGHFAVVHFLQNGLLDQSFGVNQPTADVTCPFPGAVYLNSISAGGYGDTATSSVILSDGSLVVGGSTYSNAGYNCFALANFLPNGWLKSAFGKTTTTTTSSIPGTVYITSGIAEGTPDLLTSLAVALDGKIIAAGSCSDPYYSINYCAVAQFSLDGSLDSSFGVTGAHTTSSTPGTVFIKDTLFDGNNDQLNAIMVQSNGAIIGGGLTGTTGSHSHSYAAFVRFTSFGALDSSFGVTVPNITSPFPGAAYISGSLAGGTSNQINAIALQAGGNIIATGYTVDTAVSIHGLVVSLLSNGNLNSSFRATTAQTVSPFAGAVYATIPAGTVSNLCNGVSLCQNGAILAAGANYTTTTDVYFELMNFFNPFTFAGYKKAYTPVGAGLNS